jgi:hypothetical protein
MMFPRKSNRISNSTKTLNTVHHERKGSIPQKREQASSGTSDQPPAKRQRSPRSNGSEWHATPGEDSRDPDFKPDTLPRRSMLSRGSTVAPNSSPARRTKYVRPDIHLKLNSVATNNMKITDPELYMTNDGDSFVFHLSKGLQNVHKHEINRVWYSPDGQSRYVYFDGQRKDRELKKWYLDFASAEDTMDLVDFITSHYGNSIATKEHNP